MCKFDFIKCLFGFHTYETHKQVELIDVHKNIIVTIIVSRCTRCGKIKTTEIRTVNNHSI